AERGAGLGRRALVFGRIIDGAGSDDGALAGHQPRVRRHGAHRAGVGERNGGPLEIRRRDLAGARAATRSSNALTYSWNWSAPASLMFGTMRLRAPSLPETSTAMPRLIRAGVARNGRPSCST